MKSSVELVSTGSELLNGRTVNRHANVLGDQLGLIGLQLMRDTTVSDDMTAIEEAVRSALKRADLVVVSGGLGPTSDDVTREAVAKIFDAKIVLDEGTMDSIRNWCLRTGRKLNSSMERHARVLEGAAVLQNSAGLAPGERIEHDGKAVFLLPGPPHEFHAVLMEHVLPWLKQSVPNVQRPETAMFQICGLGESDIVTRLESAGFPMPGVDVAYCAALGRVEIRLSSATASLEASRKLLREKLGDNIFAEERIDMEVAVGRLLKARKATLATAESCTGGLIGHRITNVSGSSDYFLGGVVAYSNEAKMRELDVQADALAMHGAVSDEVARQMAVGVRVRFRSDYGLSVTGIAGPTGGTPEKPVGLVYFAVSDVQECIVKELKFAGSRLAFKEWSSQMALDLQRRRLLRS